MKLYIVAIPLFDATMAVQGYRLHYRDGESVINSQIGQSRMANAMSSPGLDCVEKMGASFFSKDKPLFVDINQYQLLMGFPANKAIEPDKIICSLPGGMACDEAVLQKCDDLRQRGYSLALDDFPLNGIQSPFFEKVDYLLLNCKNTRFPMIFKAVRNQLDTIKLAIFNVPDMAAFQNLTINKDVFFSGPFYNQPSLSSTATLSARQLNALQMVTQIRQPDLEPDHITQIIQRDTALCS